MLTGAQSKAFLGLESTFGQGTESNLKYKLPLKTESLNRKIDMITSEAILGARAPKALAPGKLSAEGSMDIELWPKLEGVLFYLTLGKATLEDPDGTASSGDEYTSITPIDVGEDLPSSVVLVDHAGIKMLYKGMKINQLRLSAAIGSIPSVSVDFVGREETVTTATIDESSMTKPDTQPYTFKEISLLYSSDGSSFSSTEKYTNFELTINNNLDTDDYRYDGTGLRKTLSPANLEITGNVDIIFDTSTLNEEYEDKFVNAKPWGIQAVFEKNYNGTTYKFELILPSVIFSELTHDISDKGRLVLSGSFTAVLPSSGSIITVNDYNNTTGSY